MFVDLVMHIWVRYDLSRLKLLLNIIVIAVIILAAAGSFLVVMKFTNLISLDTVRTNGTLGMGNETIVYLPLPKFKVGKLIVEEAIAFRRSIREFKDEPITLLQLSQILWAAQGITNTQHGFRAAPSAGATYPLEIYVVVKEGGVEGLAAGIYHYDPYTHSLRLIRKGDFSNDLFEASLEQPWVRDAAVNIVITAIYERTTGRYGERGIRYVHIEVGHVGQNIYLEATNLGLGTVAIGAFYDDEVRKVLGVKSNEHPLYIMPIGVPKWQYRVTEEEIHEFILRNRGS